MVFNHMICVDFVKSQIYVGAARKLHYFRVMDFTAQLILLLLPFIDHFLVTLETMQEERACIILSVCWEKPLLLVL